MLLIPSPLSASGMKMEDGRLPQSTIDSVYVTFLLCGGNRQTTSPPQGREVDGPTACHIVTFLCLCFNFILEESF